MDQVLVRLLKPVAAACVMFGALTWLTGDVLVGVIGMLVPLLLGWLGILESVAYGLTALALIAAVCVAILPDWVRQEVTKAYFQALSRVKEAAPPTTSGP